jgi:hypothetical protein
MRCFPRVIQGTQIEASSDARDGRQFPLPERNPYVLESPPGGPSAAVPVQSEPTQDAFTTGSTGFYEKQDRPTQINRAIPGYTGIKLKYFFATNLRMKNRASIISPRLAMPLPRERQNLPGWNLAKAGPYLARAGNMWHPKFSKCQQVPDIVSYCHILSVLRGKYFCKSALVLNQQVRPQPEPRKNCVLRLTRTRERR